MGDQGIGYLCCLVACLGFGSNYIPVKKVDVHDGMFFTLFLSVGILLVGIAQWLIAGCYRFEPFAMLGGTIWATGNLAVPFIIQNCGLGIGQLVWSVTNMLTGWATGTFGLFGKEKDTVAMPGLNYIGVAVAALSLGIFSFMKQEEAEEDKRGVAASASEPGRVLLPVGQPQDAVEPGGPASIVGAPQQPPRKRFALGFGVALVAGFFFGSNFDPPTYLQQQGDADQKAGVDPAHYRHSPDAMDYVISHFVGVFLTSLGFFLVYWRLARTRFCGKEVIMPGIVSGVLWGIAQVAWFKANSVLSYVVAFPIIVGVPGVIAALWGVVLFGENRGKRNLCLLTLVIVVQGIALGLIAGSKG